MREGERINAHLTSEQGPLDQEREDALKAELLASLEQANSLEDLANIKARSLECDERTGNRMELHKAIIKRFEAVLVEKTQEVLRDSKE